MTNPILEIVRDYFRRGTIVTAVRPDNRVKPTGIIVTTKGGWNYEHPITAGNRDAFLRLWTPARRAMTINWSDWEEEVSAKKPARKKRPKKKS